MNECDCLLLKDLVGVSNTKGLQDVVNLSEGLSKSRGKCGKDGGQRAQLREVLASQRLPMGS